MSFMVAGTFDGLIRSLDSDPHHRGKQFEKIVKWWLQNDPIHSRDIKKVWLWDEWPDRPGPDIGIDLVAELKDGSLLAVQAKCFDSERDIPKSELDSFISAASPRKYGRRMLVASTDGLSANARRMLHDNHVTQVMFSYLDSLQEFWPSTFLSLGGPRTISKWGPRTHQSHAIRDVTEGLRKASRGQLIMACGTGKTLTAMWIMESLDSHSTLVLVPSLSLLSQTLLEWSQHSNESWSYLCVCSDDTVNKSDDAIISSVDDVPFPVTTKPSEIAHFLSQRGRKIIFSTYQSSAQVARGMKSVSKKFDLVICDEAHRLTGKNDAEFATALDDKKIPAKKRLFMTATPRTYTASVKSKASERGVEITSMDDEAAFGKELHKLSFGQAIEQELLTDYRVVIVGVTDPQVQELIERRELVTAGNVETDARTLAAHIGLAKATKDYDLKRTISFHGRIKTAQDFAQNHASIVEWMPDDHKPSGTIWADTITGAMNSSSRRKLLDKLKADVPGQHALLSNARCLTEGIDVPSLDGVAFIDPRSSQVDIIQAVGRAIRRADNKALGTIVLPVLIPHDADAEHALEDTAFKPIWAILNALRSHDELLAIQLDEIRTSLGRNPRSIVPITKVRFDLPANIDLLIPGFSSALYLALVERATQSWNWWYGLTSAFGSEFGQCRRFPETGYRGYALSNWIEKQRSQYRSGVLEGDKCELLLTLPEWSWEPRDEAWLDMYEAIALLQRSSGSAEIPSNANVDGKSLGTWAEKQRMRYATESLTPERVRLLNDLPFWSWTPNDDKWNSKYLLLKSFVESHNGDHPLRNSILARWIIKQRTRGDDLSSHQRNLLERIPGWSWSPFDQAWESMFEELLEWANREGNLVIPQRGKSKKLGSWLATQRMRERNNQLSPDKIVRLQQIPGWSAQTLDQLWKERFSELKLIAESLRRMPVQSELDNSGQGYLSSWIFTQRQFHKNQKLSEERVKALLSIPGWLWGYEVVDWDARLEELRAITQQLGALPRARDLTLLNQKSLLNWITTQRQKYKSGSLPLDKIKKLEDTPHWKWNLSKQR